MEKNICIIGCGQIAKVHAKNLGIKTNLFFYSRNPLSAEKYNTQFNGQGVYFSFDEVVNDQSLDALVISSPPEFHTDQICTALAKDKSVFVDKPLCISAQELIKIKSKLAKTPSAFFMVGENYYYKPSLILIKQLVQNNDIGEIISIKVKKVFEQPANSWKSKLGSLLEGGIHFISLISALVESTAVKVTAEFPTLTTHQPERHSLTHLLYQNGTQASLHYAWDSKHLTRGLFQHSIITGSKGKIVFESNGLYILLLTNEKKRVYFPGLADIAGFKAMTKDFINSLSNGSQPLSDFNKAERDLNIVFQAYELLCD